MSQERRTKIAGFCDLTQGKTVNFFQFSSGAKFRFDSLGKTLNCFVEPKVVAVCTRIAQKQSAGGSLNFHE